MTGTCARVLLALFCTGHLCADELAGAQVQLGGKTLRVEIADTVEKRTRGLSGSEPLSEDRGMLFVFPGDGRYAIWMKEMRFSLDVLWINRHGKVVHVERGLHPNTYPESFVSREPARYVLEVLAGVGRGVAVGDSVILKNVPVARDPHSHRDLR